MREDVHLPCVTERDHVVNIHICRRAPRRAIVRTEPASACACARRVGYDIGAIAFEDLFARVAGAGLSDPVGEQVARVTCLRALRGDSETSELSAGFRGRGDVGWCAGDEGRWGCGDGEG
jgi:hypothetical protein